MSASNSTLPGRKVKFTTAFVARVIKDPAPGEWADTESPLRIRSTTTGAQYRVMRKVGGKVVKITATGADGHIIADAAKVWSLSEARGWARGVVADLTRGKAPTPSRKAAAAESADAAADAVTVEAMAATLMAAYTTTAAPNSVKVRTLGVRDIVALIGSTPVSEVRARDAVMVRDTLTASRSLSVVNRAWSAASWIMAGAIEAGLAEANPFARGSVRAPARAQSRDRHLTLDQIVEVWRAAEEQGGTGPALVRFLFAMPLRATAAATMTWAEVDLDDARLTLQPVAGRKFKTVQVLPMPELAVEILRARQGAAAKPDGLVFANSEGRPFNSWYSLLRRLPMAGEWSPHDARRSVITALADEAPGLPVADLDLWLQHSRGAALGQVASIYNRSARKASLRAVAAAWDRILRMALADNVISIRKVA